MLRCCSRETSAYSGDDWTTARTIGGARKPDCHWFASTLVLFALLAFSSSAISPNGAFGTGIYPAVCDPKKMGPALSSSPENPFGSPVLLRGTVVELLPQGTDTWTDVELRRESKLGILKVDRVVPGKHPARLCSACPVLAVTLYD